ncbi:MAG: DNA-directed RNA polymerase subunit omega [Candidatus Latescibacteria bacterium]|nr:DNA-directed RNA polymerase subunit omega [Candidatus Latescibacterota bacterium]
MKFIEIEKLTEHIPNKYLTIVLASKEARKMTEATKPVQVPQNDLLPETAVPEIKVQEEPVVKKRGRKSKKSILQTPEQMNVETIRIEQAKEKSELHSDAIALEMTADKKIKRVVAGKDEVNPYIAALKKVLKRYELSEKKESTTSK